MSEVAKDAPNAEEDVTGEPRSETPVDFFASLAELLVILLFAMTLFCRILKSPPVPWKTRCSSATMSS